MKYRTRIYYTEEQKSLMWDRWEKGESLHSLAKLFDRGHGAIASILSRTGGIRPPTQKRSSTALTLSEREDISRGLASNQSLRTITFLLHRSPSTISREINRNGGYALYKATQADLSAWNRAKRPKRCKLSCNLRDTVLFNTSAPEDDPCTAGGYGYNYAVDMATGGGRSLMRTRLRKNPL